MKKLFLILLLVMSAFLFVSCNDEEKISNNNEDKIENDNNEEKIPNNNEGKIEDGNNDNINLDDNENTDNKEDDLKIETPQAPLVTADNEQILSDFSNSKYFSDGNEYEIKHIFKIYGNTIVLEIVKKDINLVDTSFSCLGFDEICFVIPAGYGKDNYNLLAYNNGQFLAINKAYSEKWLTKGDVYDLKHLFDEYFYNNDLWYERIEYKHYIQPNNFENYYINDGVLEKTTDNSKIIDYTLSQTDYEKIIESFYSKYNITNGEFAVISYYGDIDGVKLLYISPTTYAEILNLIKVGKYSYYTNHQYQNYYVYVNGKLHDLKEAYDKKVIGEYILRYAMFYDSLKTGYLFGKTDFYLAYPLNISD